MCIFNLLFYAFWYLYHFLYIIFICDNKINIKCSIFNHLFIITIIFSGTSFTIYDKCNLFQFFLKIVSWSISYQCNKIESKYISRYAKTINKINTTTTYNIAIFTLPYLCIIWQFYFLLCIKQYITKSKWCLNNIIIHLYRLLRFVYNLLRAKYNIAQIRRFINLLLNAFRQCIALLKYRHKRISDKSIKFIYIFLLLYLLIVGNINTFYLNRLTILLNSFFTRYQLTIVNINTVFFAKYLFKYFVTIVILVLHIN